MQLDCLKPGRLEPRCPRKKERQRKALLKSSLKTRRNEKKGIKKISLPEQVCPFPLKGYKKEISFEEKITGGGQGLFKC